VNAAVRRLIKLIIRGLSSPIEIPFSISAVLYFSVRVQKEGLNMETLINELEVSSGCPGIYKNVLLAEIDGEVV
jgi:hypothetical protein